MADRQDDKGAIAVKTVVKIGGGLLAHTEYFDATLKMIGTVTPTCRVLVVPGGGPFAETVREIDHRVDLSEDAAHWMAVLAMDQFAHLVASRLPGSTLVAAPQEITAALGEGRLPVLAPSRWLREADPLPHAWAVTSDSIAAWVAGAVGARRLVLVKPPGAAGSGLVDGFFTRALAAHVTPVIVAADRVDALRSALCGDTEPG